jgi:hypothetical protein
MINKWLELNLKKSISEMRRKKWEESWIFLIQLNKVSFLHGKIWKKSGSIVSQMNLELTQLNTEFFWLKLQWIQKVTEKKWLNSCSKLSKFKVSTSLFKLSFLFIQMEELQVWFATQEMELLTLFQYSKVSLFHTPSRKTSLLVEQSQITSSIF